jgi:RES domain-containing protein
LKEVFRVLRAAYAQNPFDGEGAYRFGGRWSSAGVRTSYASEHQSLAMLEYFVHLDSEDPPEDLVLVAAKVPDEVSRESIPAENLPANWRATPAPASLTNFGDRFVQQAAAAVLIVPSVLSPREHNWLLNPVHPDFFKIQVTAAEPLRYDPRMFAKRKPRRSTRRQD